MKRTIKIMMLLFIAICASVQSFAQSNDRNVSREKLAITQARHIASELALDEAITQKLVETYCACQKEIWALGSRQKRGSDTSASIENRFDRSQKILDIRKKYYAEYGKFLTPEQIDKVYRLEKRMMSRLVKKQKNLRQHNTSR
ncbi:MAG: hypothetical protein NC043_03125 [Muribaculaceae bacterium]|nr:hypothetical protein [Muribaculaceae bacterium]